MAGGGDTGEDGHDHGHHAHDHDHHGHDHHDHHEHAHDSGRHDHDGGHAHHGGVRGRVLGWLRPHSHDVADQVDSALERSAAGIRATKVTLVVLVATSALQLVIAMVSGSVALLADMVHNIADGLTSVPLWIAFVLGRRPPSAGYPYGFRRAEDVVGVFIVATIAASVLVVGWESVSRLLDPEPMRHIGWVLVAGVVGVAGNEVAAIVRIRVGERIGSAALVADGFHARTDTLASVAVVVAAVGAWLGFGLLDPLVGLAITGLLAWMLVQTARQVFRRLMDGVDPDVVGAMREAAAAVPGVREVGWARARWVGHRLHGDLAVTVDPALTVAEGHDVSEEVHHALLHRLGHLEEVTVHVNPDQPDHDPHHRTAHHRPPAG